LIYEEILQVASGLRRTSLGRLKTPDLQVWPGANRSDGELSRGQATTPDAQKEVFIFSYLRSKLRD
jgi:hypothetical protein